MARLRPAIANALLSMGALAALLLTLVSVDDRVREQLAVRFGSGRASTELARAGTHARDLAGVVIDAVRDQSIDHAPLVIFSVAAVVLVLFMIRL